MVWCGVACVVEGGGRWGHKDSRGVDGGDGTREVHWCMRACAWGVCVGRVHGGEGRRWVCGEDEMVLCCVSVG